MNQRALFLAIGISWLYILGVIIHRLQSRGYTEGFKTPEIPTDPVKIHLRTSQAQLGHDLKLHGSQDPTDDTWLISGQEIKTPGGQCLGTRNQLTLNGTPVTLSGCDQKSDKSQVWKVDEYGRILHHLSGKYLTRNTKTGGLVIKPKTSSEDQLWYFELPSVPSVPSAKTGRTIRPSDHDRDGDHDRDLEDKIDRVYYMCKSALDDRDDRGDRGEVMRPRRGIRLHRCSTEGFKSSANEVTDITLCPLDSQVRHEDSEYPKNYSVKSIEDHPDYHKLMYKYARRDRSHDQWPPKYLPCKNLPEYSISDHPDIKDYITKSDCARLLRRYAPGSTAKVEAPSCRHHFKYDD